MQEYDLSNVNGIFKRIGRMIDSDPLVGTANEIGDIQEKFKAIKQAIENEGKGEKEQTNAIFKIFTSWVGNSKEFKYGTFEGKITAIFGKYDIIHKSIGNIKNMYQSAFDELSVEFEAISQFIEGIKDEEKEQDDIMLYNNYIVMRDNLKLSLDRCGLSLSSCVTLDKTMKNNRPTFEVILAGCMMEVSGNSTIDSANKINYVMSNAIEGLSDTLTTQVAGQAKNSLETGSKPALSMGSLEKNKLLLEKAIDELEGQKKLAYVEFEDEVKDNTK